MNNPIASILDGYPALVIDGALATELERRGCDLNDELWSAKILLEQPETIKTELLDFHRPRMKVLIEAGADILACETIPCLIEAQAIAELLKEFPNIAAWVSFTGHDEKHISEGQVFADCVRQLENNPQIAAIGINCTSPEYISALIREARKVTDKPVLVYPNSGETYDATRNDWNGDPVLDSFGEQAREWYDAGARLIGGCCRTTPEDIRVIAGWARSSRSRKDTPALRAGASVETM